LDLLDRGLVSAVFEKRQKPCGIELFELSGSGDRDSDIAQVEAVEGEGDVDGLPLGFGD
jgi:hypothetical protein